MNFSQFVNLPDIQKMRAIWYQGVLVASQTESVFQFELYQISDFYVEQKTHILSGTRKYVKAFRGTNDLDKYLCGIDISVLLEEGRS